MGIASEIPLHPIVFVSHSTDDAPIAAAVKPYLEGLFLGVDVFVSTRDLTGGRIWMKTLHEKLVAARAIVAIVTPTSQHNPWVHFEAGVGFAEEKTIPLCADGLTPGELIAPFALLQARSADSDGLKLLAADVAALLSQRVPREFPTLADTTERIKLAGHERASSVNGVESSEPVYDPVLSESWSDINKRLRQAVIEAILRYPALQPLPVRPELEKMSQFDLEQMAQAYEIDTPSRAIFALCMLDLPLANDPEWKKINARKSLEEASNAMDHFVQRGKLK